MMPTILGTFEGESKDDDHHLEERHLVRCDCGRLFTCRPDEYTKTMTCRVCEQAITKPTRPKRVSAYSHR
jgi:hypothetical protein